MTTLRRARSWPRPLFFGMAMALLVSAPAVLAHTAHASGDAGLALDRAHIDLSDKPSLQRGARVFVNYCLSCHSASFMRYNRMGEDIGISDELVKRNLMFASSRTGDLMITTMPEEDAERWFGVAPPDLSLSGRFRGGDWLYTYLRSFYLDEETPSGWNNSLFENVAMPHVLYELQGIQRPVMGVEEREFEGEMVEVEKIMDFTLERPGSLDAEEYDSLVRDLVNFMVYMSEPARLQRRVIGFWVVVFLLVLLAPAYLLKKEYWKDVV